MSCGDKTAARVPAQRVLCLQSRMNKAPSSPDRGAIEEDQGVAVGLVNTAVRDRWPQFLPASWIWLANIVGLFWIMTDKDASSFSVHIKAFAGGSAAGQFPTL